MDRTWRNWTTPPGIAPFCRGTTSLFPVINGKNTVSFVITYRISARSEGCLGGRPAVVK